MSGAFHLSISLEKDAYRRNESIPVTLHFANAGTSPIALEGILPLRESVEPPCLEIETDDSRLIRVETGILRSLMNPEPIVVQPGRSVLLMQVDLLDSPAWIRTKDEADRGDHGRTVARLAADLIPGDYSIQGSFRPAPREYAGATEWISFTIR